MIRFPITADIATIFNTAEFAQPVSDGVNTFDAIITEDFDLMNGGSVGIEGAQLICIAQSSDVSLLDSGDILTATLTGDEFIIIPPLMPDDTGLTRLKLARN